MSRRPALVTAVLLDADGTLFPSEEPAFEASAVVTRELARHFGLHGDFSAESLRVATTGKNFRSTVGELLAAGGVAADPEDIERWIVREKVAVTAHLARTLRPDPEATAALDVLAARFHLAAVSSSASTRLDACFAACRLDARIPPQRRFSAEDSLAVPRAKPDPAIYSHALAHMGLRPEQAVAVEDSASGAAAAVAAGIRTVGFVRHVPPAERSARVTQLSAVGASVIRTTWAEVIAELAAVPRIAVDRSAAG